MGPSPDSVSMHPLDCHRTDTGHLSQELEKNSGRTRRPIGPQGVIRNFPATLPTLPDIQALGVTARDRIEHQQRLAALQSTTLGGSEQRCTHALPAYSSRNEHLRDV